jgi:tetratricopeptide (TPR) repeat protein
MVHAAQGRFDAALSALEQGRAADALSPPQAFVETFVQLLQRDFDTVIAGGKKLLELHPASPIPRMLYAEALACSGQIEEALVQYRFLTSIARDIPWMRALEATCLARNGRLAEARETLDDLQRIRVEQHIDGYHIALLLDALGRRDEAFQELERAYSENSWLMLFLDSDPKADSLRSDPRYGQMRSSSKGANQ